jgi:glutamate/tyrosine decarboxylase-like PLP-dependent enzyme
MKVIETVFKYSVNTLNPYFFDKLYAGSDPIGQVAELVTAVLNTALHVYQVSPVFSVMEVECYKIIGQQFGLKEENIDGCSNPGGTMSNMMA